MNKIIPFDASRASLAIDHDLSVTAIERLEGRPPIRVDGMTVGIVTMHQSAPHGGEMHPDGDEILYVIQGRLRVIGDSAPEQALLLEPGDGCIVGRGEWHRVEVLEPTHLIHITAGPGSEHRPVAVENPSAERNDE